MWRENTKSLNQNKNQPCNRCRGGKLFKDKSCNRCPGGKLHKGKPSLRDRKSRVKFYVQRLKCLHWKKFNVAPLETKYHLLNYCGRFIPSFPDWLALEHAHRKRKGRGRGCFGNNLITWSLCFHKRFGVGVEVVDNSYPLVPEICEYLNVWRK